VRFGFAVNRADDVLAAQTTAMLMAAAVRRGHRVCAFGVGDIALAPSGRVVAAARQLDATAIDAGRVAHALVAAAPRALVLDGREPLDALVIRTNPARDAERQLLHALLIGLAQLLDERGVCTLNAPSGLLRAASKLYLAALPPGTVPPATITADAQALVAAVRDAAGPSVLKPLAGTRGRGVFKVAAADPNLQALAELLTSAGPAMAQAWAPGAEAGDVRVVLVDGELLLVNGHLAAIRRSPAEGDFRSNLHAGGTPAPAELTAAQRATLAAIGPRLAADGLWLAGVDLIGPWVIEVNVFATGGLRDAERFEGVDFAGAVIEGLEARVGGRSPR